MKKPPPIPAPRLPHHDEADDWPEGEIEAQETYKGLNLLGLDWAHAEALTLVSCRIQATALSNLSLVRLELDDVLVEDCNMSSTDMSQGSTRRTVFADSRITGLKLNSSRIGQTVFRQCQGKYMQAVGTVFKDVRFENCSLLEANFDHADLRGVVFADCELQDATFTGAKLQGADFRTSRIESSRVAPEALAGALVTPSQAVALFQRYTQAVILDL